MDTRPPGPLPDDAPPAVSSEQLLEARDAYERLVKRYEATHYQDGVHWEELTDLEREYWARVWIALRRVPGQS